MFFQSLAYLVFFSAVFALYWAVPWARARVYLLLAASYYFYYSWSAELALLVASTTVVDFFLARGLEAARRAWLRKALLVVNVCMNLGLLIYFKYMNFFIAELAASLDSLGLSGREFLERNYLLRDILVPFGISFYTFEAISYCFDVFRGKLKAERNLANFMLFILFFPHLVAGPIVRGGDFLPQVRRRKRWSWLRGQVGVEYFLMGLFLKLAVADRMALYAEPVFTRPGEHGTSALWIGTLAFAIQIYADFAGYSAMAIGSAHLLGYRLTHNFDMPYLSKNVAEFWRRWHISLSNWLRDYVFIPLGGSRGGTLLTCRNLMATMLLGGLWHGATWSFLIWGAIHGALLVGHRLFTLWAKDRPRLRAVLDSTAGTVWRVGFTFLCVMLTWVFFQKSLDNALTMLSRMFTLTSGQPLPVPNKGLWATVGLLMLCHLVTAKGWWQRYAVRLPAPAVGAGYAVALSAALVLAPDVGKAFIYFDF